MRPVRPFAATLIVMALPLLACKSAALSFVSDAVAQSGTGYGNDDDPELVREAVPFGLKTMEGLLQEKPHHVGLLTALTSNFTQYTYAFVQGDAVARGGRGF